MMISSRAIPILGLLTCAPALAGDPFHIPAPSAPPQIEFVAERPDLHGPIGVLGDHPQAEGTWQFSYRYQRTDMHGILKGQEELSVEEVFARGYESTPTRMVRETHLFSLLHGYSDDLSLLLTIPWISNEMRFKTAGGDSGKARVIGMGDLQLTGMYSLKESEEEQLHVNLGLRLPTGSRDEKDRLPGGGGVNQKVPYPMQLGSGTFDLVPGLTWFRALETVSMGAQVSQTIRLGRNSEGYSLGDRTELTGWVARRLRDDLSGSVRVALHHTGKISGDDDKLSADFDPSQDPSAQGGDRLDLFFGLNYTRPGGHRFAAEIGGPIYQNLNGPQLETDVMYVVGWQFSF